MGSVASPLDLLGVGWIVLSIGITMAIGWLLLTNADRIFRRAGRMGVYAMSRIMGILIAAVAVQFMFSGITYWLLNVVKL